MSEILTYKQILGECSFSTERRFDLEWSNTWIDNANYPNNTGRRILLIGDSVIRMARSNLAKIEKCPVDLIASSYNLDDYLFCQLIDGFFGCNAYRYSTIFIQISHHGDNLQKKDFVDNGFDPEIYKKNITTLVSFVKQYCSRVILVSILDFYSSHKSLMFRVYAKLQTWGIVKDFGINLIKQKKDEKKNLIVNERNKIVYEIASCEGLEFLDFEAKLTKYKFLRVDSIHPHDKMKPQMSLILSEALNKVLC